MLHEPDAAAQTPPETSRRASILAAAARAFVREGFHAATMIDVAEEAGMSAGNLYRYFPSKEAIVEGICTLDKMERERHFETLAASSSILDSVASGIETHLLASPRQKMLLVLEIWAEAGRNGKIAEIGRSIDADVQKQLTVLFESAKERGEAAATLEASFAARVIFTLVSGLLKRRAHEADFNAKAEAGLVRGIMAALFAGAVPRQSQTPAGEER